MNIHVASREARSALDADDRASTAEHRPAILHIALIVDPACVRLAYRELAERLASQAGARVTILRGQATNAAPSQLELMFQLERILGRIVGPRLADRIDASALFRAGGSEDDTPDLVVDLCGGAPGNAASRTLSVRYDGIAGEIGLIAALLAGRMPTLEIVEAQTGAPVASARPCADNASALLEAFDCVLARLVTSLVALARNPRSVQTVAGGTAPAPSAKSLAAFELRAITHQIVRALYALCFYTPHWRTCWRFLSEGGVWQSKSLAGKSWQVIPDPGFRFYADPFPFEHDGRTYVFVEDLDHHCNKGVISVIPFDKSGPCDLAHPVLEEPWHLSYPFLMKHDGEIWMIPESSAGKCVTLYRAVRFPDRWEAVATLLSGIEASDATVVHHNGWFWMFAATRDGWGSWSDTLSIFFARELCGPWQAHGANSVLIDQAAARPAGAMVVRDDKLWRPVQDCTNGYGTGIGLAEVTELDPARFRQTVHTVLRAEPSWPGRRLHTLNQAGGIECIDGSAYSPRSRILARRLQGWSGRREPPPGWTSASSNMSRS